MVEVVTFGISAAIIVCGAVGVVLWKNPVKAALSLVASLLGVAVIMVQLEAHFLAFTQVVVYGGAIVVMFLFVIMFLGVDRLLDLEFKKSMVDTSAAILFSLGFGVVLMLGLFMSGSTDPDEGGAVALSGVEQRSPISILGADGEPIRHEQLTDTAGLTREVFGHNLIAFQAVGLLLTVVTVGTVVLVKYRPAVSPSTGGVVE